jgi:hypothetical protein
VEKSLHCVGSHRERHLDGLGITLGFIANPVVFGQHPLQRDHDSASDRHPLE